MISYLFSELQKP